MLTLERDHLVELTHSRPGVGRAPAPLPALRHRTVDTRPRTGRRWWTRRRLAAAAFGALGAATLVGEPHGGSLRAVVPSSVRCDAAPSFGFDGGCPPPIGKIVSSVTMPPSAGAHLISVGDRIKYAPPGYERSRRGTVVGRAGSLWEVDWDDGTQSSFVPRPGSVTLAVG